MAIQGSKAPGQMLRDFLKERGWNQEDLALILGRSARSINDIARGKTGVTPEMALSLGAAFGNGPDAWLRADAMYRLSLSSVDTSDIERRSRLFSRAPIREMQRRGWLLETSDLQVLESELDRFFGGDLKSLSVATRRGTAPAPHLSPAEAAWCFRAKQIASTSLATPFLEARLGRAKADLKRLAAHPKEARHLSSVLAEYGIRFVVVEPFAGTRIDGATFWDETGPIIATSIRHDRVDGFWFTVMHEFSHVIHGDPISVDSEMVDAVSGVNVKLAEGADEARADSEAASSLIATKELDSFVNRVGPLYSRDRVIQFANRIRIHPGIIVGQLQYRGEIGYSSLRDLLVKIRENVISTALTDGWGQVISPLVIRRLS